MEKRDPRNYLSGEMKKTLEGRKKLESSFLARSFEVTVKTSKMGEKVINVKPEYEDLRKIAENLGIPLREVLREVEKNIG